MSATLAFGPQGGQETKKGIDSRQYDLFNEKFPNEQEARARRKLFLDFLSKYLYKITGKYNSKYMGKIPVSDLEQIIREAAMRAALTFDSSRGFCFPTYAGKLVDRDISSALEGERNVKLKNRQMFFAVLKSRNSLRVKLGCEPTVEEIASDSGLTVKAVKNVSQQLDTSEVSLFDATNNDSEDRTIADVIQDMSFLSPDDYLELKQKLEFLVSQIKAILELVKQKTSADDFEIFCLFYGLKSGKETYEQLPYKEVGLALKKQFKDIRVSIQITWQKMRAKRVKKIGPGWTGQEFSDLLNCVVYLKGLLSQYN